MKRLFCLIFLAISIPVFAQEVTYSAYEKFDLHAGDYSVVGKIGDRIYTYRSSSEGYFLDALDENMKRTATVVLDFFPDKIYETRFITYPDKIIVLFQGNERGRITQYVALLDAEGRLQGKVLKLDEAKTGIFGASGSYFSSVVSEDKKRIMVYAATAKGAKLRITHTLLDDQLKILKRKESHFEGENALTVLPGMLDNNGTFYLPVTTNTGSRDYADGIWVLSLAEGAEKLMAKEIALDGMYASGMFFKMDNTAQKIYAGGFYSAKKTGNYDGVLLGQMTAGENPQVSVRRLALDDRIRAASGHNKHRAFNDYQTRQLIIRNDGGFVLLAEDYDMVVRTRSMNPYGYYYSYYSPFMSTQNIREFHYGDIMALSFGSEGQLEWSSFVRKDQISQEDGGIFSSYSFVNTGGSLGFLYNDFNIRLSRINMAVVDATGKVESHALNAGGDSFPDWMPRAGKQVSAHELIVPCIRKRQICFAKIAF